MGEYQFGVTGQDRKALVGAISEFLNIPSKYLGAPGFKYQIGDYIIDRHGTLFGAYDEGLFAQLAERGFVSLVGTSDEEDAPEAETDTISITMPLDGFTPEAIDNLCKMVIAKEPLIEKALGVESIPIRVLETGIEFPWFRAEHANDMMAYSQFISALCETAKEKKRVTAKPQAHFENERFTLRVWLIGLGLIGGEYSRIRQLLTKPLSGNGAWRYGVPERAVTEAAPAPETIPSDETPAYAAPADKTPNVRDTTEYITKGVA